MFQANVGGADRVVRAVVGIVLLGMALKGHLWGWFGIIPLLTAVVRFCPAYLPFGFRTCSSR